MTFDKINPFLQYLKVFYNSVNSLYSTISWPKVAVSIHGIEICKVSLKYVR